MTTRAAFLGILMLDTRFPRILGDAGNPESYPFPVRIKTVPGADAPEIVRAKPPGSELRERFLVGARELEAEGAVAIISTCGFLIHLQTEIAKAIRVPVMVSALSLYPIIRTSIGAAPLGVLTASAASLTDKALQAAGIDGQDVEIEGFENCPAFADVILRPRAEQACTLDRDAIEAHAVACTVAIKSRRPEVRAILLECGNLPPYAPAIRKEIGLPVFSSADAARILWEAGTGRS